MRLEYSRDAISDLKRLRTFIAEHNPTAAIRVASEMKQGVEALKSHPKLGHGVLHATDPESIRDLVLGKYVVRYLLLQERVVILRIWHHLEDERS
jgi:addiction module RelE/StbE family toxin